LFFKKKPKEERNPYQLEIKDMKYVKINRLINNSTEDISKTIDWQENFSEKDQRKIRKEAIKYLKEKLDDIEVSLASNSKDDVTTKKTGRT